MSLPPEARFEAPAHPRPLVRGLLGALLLLAAPAGAAGARGGGSWPDLADLSLARQEVGAARIGDTIYVVGGLVGGFPLQATRTVEAFDVVTGTWSPSRPMPEGLDHPAVAAADGHLLVFGGFAADFNARDGVWIYDPGTDLWTAGADLPEPRGAAIAVELGGLVYLFGGVNASDVAQSTTFVYDPVADSWTSAAPMTVAREHLTAARYGEHVYVIGGRGSPGAGVANERYHPASDTWQTMAPMPTSRSAMATAALGSRIYVSGGEVPVLFSITESYDVASDQWGCAAPMPIPRHGAGAVALADRILVAAGGEVQGVLPSTAVDALQPPAVLTTDTSSVSLAAGGTQTLSIHAGAGLAGELHLVLGSASGLEPGLPASGLVVPLNLDGYLLFTLTSPNSAPLSGSLGLLDGAGDATAQFALPPGADPTLAGLELHHAFLVLDAATLVPRFASNAMPVALVP